MTWVDWMWLILTFVCVIVELLTADIFFILFAIGTLVAFVVALMSVNVTVQVIVFAVITLLCLLFLRPVVRRWLHIGKYGKDYTVPDSIEQNIGKEGVVVRAIEQDGKGQVKIGSEVWTARTTDNTALGVRRHVRVVRIEGVTAVVQPISSLK